MSKEPHYSEHEIDTQHGLLISVVFATKHSTSSSCARLRHSQQHTRWQRRPRPPRGPECSCCPRWAETALLGYLDLRILRDCHPDLGSLCLNVDPLSLGDSLVFENPPRHLQHTCIGSALTRYIRQRGQGANQHKRSLHMLPLPCQRYLQCQATTLPAVLWDGCQQFCGTAH